MTNIRDQLWLTEPDEKSFTAHGFRCELVRHPEMKHWCGYVWLPPGHPRWGQEELDFSKPDLSDIEVHGGVTYANEQEGFWVVGMDCAHARDYVPGLSYHHDGEVYRDMTFAEAEVTRMAEQLKHERVEMVDADRHS